MLFGLLIILPLTVVVWVVLRLLRVRVKSFERLHELIGVVVLFTWLAILFIGLPTYAAVSLIGAHLGLWHSSFSPPSDMDDLPGDPADYVTLIAPPGAESAPVSHGDRAYPTYPETPGDPRSRWLVRVPRYVSFPLLRVGGFVALAVQ